MVFCLFLYHNFELLVNSICRFAKSCFNELYFFARRLACRFEFFAGNNCYAHNQFSLIH